MRLTKKDIERANKRRKYADGRGLFLSVSANGRKTWAFCYRFPDPNGRKGYREREMGLGSLDDVSLDAARDRAVELRRLVREGIDPLEDRQRTKRDVIRKNRDGSTFKDVAERFIATKKAEWDKGGKSEQSWRGSLGQHVYPAIGDMRIDRIDRADILELLRPIWKPKAEGGIPVTAGKLLPRLDMIFDEAIESGLRPLPNPADRASIRKSLPKLTKIHSPKSHASLSYRDVPAFMTKLRSHEGVVAKAMELLILTGLRTSEVALARWDEIDFENAVWTIPATRMKVKRTGGGEFREAHRVPLSKPAIQLLKGIVGEEGNPYVFNSITRRKRGQHIHEHSMLKLLKDDMGYAGEATIHGFRSSVRTWGQDETDYQFETLEMVLAHYPADQTVNAYARSDLFEKRIPIMDDWARFVMGQVK